MTMLTYNPVLIHGRTVWDTAELPVDEFEERLRAVRQLLVANGVQACIILGTSSAYANLSYLTGGRPGGVNTSVLLVHAAHPSVMLAGLGGSRGEDHVRSVNFIGDVRYYPSTVEGSKAVMADWGVSSGRVGLVGALRDTPVIGCSRFEAGLSHFNLIMLDDAFAALRAKKRPRELLELRLAAELMAKVREAAVASFIRTSSPYRAALEAELVGRVDGARDVRVLASLGDGPQLRPITEFRGASSARRLVMHLALERNGYWAEATFSYPRVHTPGGQRAHAAVRAMSEAAHPGVTLGMVAERGLEQLSGEDRDFALEIGLGQGIGLGPESELAIVPGSRAELAGGEVLSLRCVVAEDEEWYADSDLLHVSITGNRRLGSLWWA